MARFILSALSASLTALTLSSSVHAAASSSPSRSAARFADTTSEYAGVALPKGADRNADRWLTQGLGHLLADGAKEFRLPAREGGPEKAEVVQWGGSNYKSARVPFMKTILQSALTEAGYSITHVDAHVDNVPNVFDEEKYGLGGLNLGPFNVRLDYFYAKNSANGKTLIGVWLDKEEDNRLILALVHAGSSETGTGAAKVPEVAGPDVWLVKDLKHATKGMPTTASVVSFPSLSAKPGTVRGMVRDSSGKPIAGAHLIAQSSAAGGFRTSAEARTNAQGYYEIPLPVGIAQIVNADCRVGYNGDSLLLPLDPADGERDNFDSRQGHVENFVLRGGGSAGADGGDYGALIRILTYDAPEGDIVEVTLKPVGPLLDGSKGKTLVFRWKSRPIIGSSETFLGGVPIGKYTLTAKVYDGSDALPLRAKPTFHERDEDEPQLTTSLPVEFKSINGGKLANLGQSGIQRFEVTLRP